MPDLACQPWPDYECLDAGNGRKLERFGSYILSRPSPQAIWPTRLSEHDWAAAHARYERAASGGGSWQYLSKLPAEWPIRWNSLSMLIKPTGFGHVGLFPEQQPHWLWVQRMINRANTNSSVLNVFGYTGAMTLAAAQADAAVCHLDGSKGAVDWARDNARRNRLDSAPIRWIVDDALKFVMRERKRGQSYDAIIMDPPSYGRGPKGQVFKIENDLQELIEASYHLLSATPLFVLLTCHTPELSAIVLANMLLPLQRRFGGTVESGNTVITLPERLLLPSGYYARWSNF